MKKILFFIESLAGGGAEKVLTTILQNIDKSKYDITVLTVVNTGVYVSEVEECCRLITMLPEYESVSTPVERMLYKIRYKFIYNASAELVYRRFIHEKYDVEIAFVEGFATKIIAASPNKKSKKICWLHSDMINNPYADCFYSSLKQEQEIYRQYDSIVAVSKSVKKAFEQKFGHINKVEVVYNPIDSVKIEEKATETIQIEKTCGLQIISIGRLVKQKGYDRLISALASPRNINLAYNMMILGEGPERPVLEEMIQQKQLAAKIHLLGFQKNPYPWIRYSDVFVCSSRAEGYSLVIAEAIALGKPIISVDCAGPNELLDYGKCGVLIDNTDSQLEETIHLLLTNRIDLKKYSLLSKKQRNRFGIEDTMTKLDRILQ